MGKISTKELMESFFTSSDVVGTSTEKQRPVVDKQSLYDYERSIGKELIDMDVEDLFGLIDDFARKRNGDVQFLTIHRSYNQISSLLRKIFDYYIDNFESIKNPFHDKRMKGRQATERLSKDKVAFRWDMVEKIIEDIHNDLIPDKADYIELIMLMYYCGFEKAEEIVNLKENMINHKNKTVALLGRTVHLSDRCYYLLVKFHNKEEINGQERDKLVSWRNSYFKFIVRANQADEIDERIPQRMCDILNRMMSTNVNKKFNTKINYTTLYWLGFYEFLVRRYGELEIYRMMTSFRDANDVSKLLSSASEYGVRNTNISHIKSFLRPFISNISE